MYITYVCWCRSCEHIWSVVYVTIFASWKLYPCTTENNNAQNVFGTEGNADFDMNYIFNTCQYKSKDHLYPPLFLFSCLQYSLYSKFRVPVLNTKYYIKSPTIDIRVQGIAYGTICISPVFFLLTSYIWPHMCRKVYCIETLHWRK